MVLHCDTFRQDLLINTFFTINEYLYKLFEIVYLLWQPYKNSYEVPSTNGAWLV